MTTSSKTPTTTQFTSREFAALREGLEQYVVRLRAELEAAEHGAHTDFIAPRDDVGDAADHSVFAGDAEVSRSLADNAQQLLAQCQLALGRFEDDRYGMCDSCDKPIEKERLRALPQATLCLRCREDRPAGRRSAAEPPA